MLREGERASGWHLLCLKPAPVCQAEAAQAFDQLLLITGSHNLNQTINSSQGLSSPR